MNSNIVSKAPAEAGRIGSAGGAHQRLRRTEARPHSQAESDKRNSAQPHPTPASVYKEWLKKPDFIENADQQELITRLDRLHSELIAQDQRKKAALAAIKRLFAPPPPPPQGIYIWGGVGRGKTALATLFYDSLPLEGKVRTHFHRFLADVHDRLRATAGRNPLAQVAAGIARETPLILVDEMQVIDIGDAMILAGFFEHLFANGATLVTTANSPPDDLYANGLQRRRFVPTISLLKRHCELFHLGGDVDFRLRELEREPLWMDAGPAAEKRMARLFAGGQQAAIKAGNAPLIIHGRQWAPRLWHESIAWLDFAELCAAPRMKSDYIELSRLFSTLLVSDIPRLDAQRDDEARRFINLIDELYERRVKLLASAAAAPADIYGGTRLAGDFQRTASRLIEMQTRSYLARPHLP